MRYRIAFPLAFPYGPSPAWVAVERIRWELSSPSSGVPHQMTSSPSSSRSGNSARVAMVAAMTCSLPTTTDAGERTTMSGA